MWPVLCGFLTDQFQSSDQFTTAQKAHIVSSCALAVSTMLDESSYPVLLLAVKNSGFIVAPFQASSASEDYDTAHALALLTLKIAGFDLDRIAAGVVEGGMELIEILLMMQQHPHQPIAILALDFWLDLQDIPTAKRDPTLNRPLYSRLLNIFVKRAAYSNTFTNWENEYELDIQEFDEYRRQINDVIVTSYYLLRVDFLNLLLEILSNNPPNNWTVTESILFVINSASREVCQRIKARGSGMIATDREATGNKILQLTQQLCSGGAESALNQHPLVLSSASKFLGAFASVLNDCCSNEDILGVLSYLHDAMNCEAAAEAAATSIRAVFLNCSSKLNGNNAATTMQIFAQLIETGLKTKNAKVVMAITEGCTRLSLLFVGESSMRGLGLLCTPVLKQITDSLVFIKESEASNRQDGQVEVVMQCLSLALKTLATVVNFLDGNAQVQTGQHPMAELLNVMWPLLQDIASRNYCRRHPDVLRELLGVHGRCVGSFGEIIEPKISELINVVVQAYEESHASCCCEFVGIAVEKFSAREGGVEDSFCKLLGHLCINTVSFLQTTPGGIVENTELVRSFFDMCQRFLLFCPRGLLKCTEFNNLFSFAVACIRECKGEKNSTRSSLIFLSQIIGRKGTELSRMILEQARGAIDGCVGLHGEGIVACCLTQLAGGNSALQQPFIDLLYATIFEVVSQSEPGNNNTVAHQWVFTALNDESVVRSRDMDNDVKGKLMNLMFVVVGREGGIMERKKFSNLMADFVDLIKKEVGADALLVYE